VRRRNALADLVESDDEDMMRWRVDPIAAARTDLCRGTSTPV
jgi:hypothetical protein